MPPLGDTDNPPSAWSQRKPNPSLRFPTAAATFPNSAPYFTGGGHSQNAAPAFDSGPRPQSPLLGFDLISHPRTAEPDQFSSNPFASNAGPKGLPPGAVNPWAPDLERPRLRQDEPESPRNTNFAEKRAEQLGIPEYTPMTLPGSQFPLDVLNTLYGKDGNMRDSPAVFKTIYGKDEKMRDTPLQQQIKYDIEQSVTQALDVPTMIKYANMQRDADQQKAEREENTPWKRREREVAKVGEQRDPKAPNGCIYGMCNMPRGEHATNCMGVGREGVNCSDAEHAVGNCDERVTTPWTKSKVFGMEPAPDVTPVVHPWAKYMLPKYEPPILELPSSVADPRDLEADPGVFEDAMAALEADPDFFANAMTGMEEKPGVFADDMEDSSASGA